jgi:hypothetical protein
MSPTRAGADVVAAEPLYRASSCSLTSSSR